MEDSGYLVWKYKYTSPNTLRAFLRLLGFHFESFYILPSVRTALEDWDGGQHSWGLRLLLLMRAADIWLQKKTDIETHAQVFLCAHEEQLDSCGVVLLQRVLQPLPANRNGQLHKKLEDDKRGGSTSMRSPHMGKRANIIDIKRDDDNWKRRKTLKLMSLIGFQQVTAV